MEDADARGAARFEGDVVFEFGVQGHGAFDGLGEDQEGRFERDGIGVGRGGRCRVEELSKTEKFALFSGGVDEFVGYVGNGGVFEADN